MAFTLWNLLKAALLILNAMAILHAGRFLRQYGLDKVDASTGVKQQVAGMLHAARYARAPLIAVNLVVITIEVLFG